MFPLLMQQPRDGARGLISVGHGRSDDIHGIGGFSQGGVGDPCLVLTSDPKPRLRWTADLHDRFVDAVTQLGGPNSYSEGHIADNGRERINPLSLEKPPAGPESNMSDSKLVTPDANEGFEVKEALRAQMEVQSKLHLQIEAEKHLQIRQDAERRYMAMLDAACKMLADHYIGGAVIDTDKDNSQPIINKPPPPSFPFNTTPAYTFQSTTLTGLQDLEELLPSLGTQRADCSSESCLTSHDSPAAYTLQPFSSGSRKRMLNADSAEQRLLWGEANMRMPKCQCVPGNNWLWHLKLYRRPAANLAKPSCSLYLSPFTRWCLVP